MQICITACVPLMIYYYGVRYSICYIYRDTMAHDLGGAK